jgi:hypothetical protein
MYWYPQETEMQQQVQKELEPHSKEPIFDKLDYPVVDNQITQEAPLLKQPDTSANDTIMFPTLVEKPKTNKNPPKRSVRFYKKPLSSSKDEWLAQKVYRETGNLQEVEARQLVDTYGRKAVGQALGRMEYLREKGELENPAGFMKVVSRVCWRTIHELDTKMPAYKSPKKRKPRKKARNSKQDAIWQSEAYRQWRLSFADAPIDIWELSQMNEIDL